MACPSELNVHSSLTDEEIKHTGYAVDMVQPGSEPCQLHTGAHPVTVLCHYSKTEAPGG